MLASQIGYYSLILGLIFSIYLCVISIKDFHNSNRNISPNVVSLSFLQLTFVIISFISLILSFIKSDFSNETVFNNSHTTKPMFYKISGTWGNHEGSLLLWLNVLAIFSYLFLINKNHNKNYKLYTLVFQNILILGFLIFLLINSNPFALIIPTPKEGLGLNPILQDVALAIHPPLLYIGFVGSSIYFSAAASSLLTNFDGKLFPPKIHCPNNFKKCPCINYE